MAKPQSNFDICPKHPHLPTPLTGNRLPSLGLCHGLSPANTATSDRGASRPDHRRRNFHTHDAGARTTHISPHCRAWVWVWSALHHAPDSLATSPAQGSAHARRPSSPTSRARAFLQADGPRGVRQLGQLDDVALRFYVTRLGRTSGGLQEAQHSGSCDLMNRECLSYYVALTRHPVLCLSWRL